jgi:hypothetical protein
MKLIFPQIKIRWEHIVLGFILITFFAYSYQDLLKVYYMHDEWRTLSYAFLYRTPYWPGDHSLARILFGRIRILGTGVNYLIYNFFPFKSSPFIIISVLLQIANIFLFYRILQRLTKQRIISFVSSLYFAVSSTAQQAISWLGAGVEALGSVFFLFLSIHSFISYVHKRKPKYLIVSIILLYIGYLFKETAIVVVPIYLYFIVKIKHPKLLSNIFHILSTAIIAIISLALFTYFFVFSEHGFLHSEFLVSPQNIINIFYYPFVSISQCFIPFRLMYKLGFWFISYAFPIISRYNDAPTIVYFIVSDLLSVMGSFIFLILLYVLYNARKNRKILMLSGAFYFFSFIPIAFALPARNASYIDSRLMYMPMIAASIWFSLFFDRLVDLKKKKPIVAIGLILCMCFTIFKQLTVTKREVNETAISGVQMTNFIRAFRKENSHRVLPQKTVYYFLSDRNYYYENNKLPFLLGSGYIIGILQFPTGAIPREALEKEKFIEFGSQGYIQSDTKAFGYYYDFNTLLQDYKNHVFDGSQLVAYQYSSVTFNLTDITSQVLDKLNNE